MADIDNFIKAKNDARYCIHEMLKLPPYCLNYCLYVINRYILHKKNYGNIRFAVCAILKNEGDYLEEWLNYHHLIGVDKFYIYDNDSDDRTAEILKAYEKKGWVEYNTVHGRGMQIKSYNKCIKRHRWDTEYIAFIDGDEFLDPLNSTNIYETVSEITCMDKKAAGIIVPWRMFASSGHVTKPDTDVIHSYLYYARSEEPVGVKRIVKPEYVYKFTNPHLALFFGPYYTIDENGKRIDTWNCLVTTINKIQLNHYFTKSQEEWTKRRAMGMADHTDDHKRDMDEFYAADHNDVYDDSIVKLEESILR